MGLFSRGYERRIAVGWSDTHGGHVLGFCPPEVRLPRIAMDGSRYWYTPELTKTQEWLQSCFEEDLAEVVKLADGDPIILLHNGDETDGGEYKDQQVCTQEGAQFIIAEANFEPWYRLPNLQKVRFLSGTPAHNFGEDTSTIEVVDRLRAKHPNVDTDIAHHALFDIDTVTFDTAHHGPTPGRRQYTKGRQLTYYTESIMQEALEDWETPPDVVLRGHYHELCWQTCRKKTKHGVYTTEAVILPAYCGLSEHGRQVTRSVSSIDCGMVAFEIVDEELRGIYPFYRKQDLRTKEEL